MLEIIDQYTFTELYNYIVAVKGWIILGCTMMSLFIIFKSLNNLDINMWFFSLIGIAGFLMVCLMFVPVTDADDETHISEWITVDNTDDSIREVFIDCDIVMDFSHSSRESLFENCTFYDNSGSNMNSNFYDSLIINVTLVTNNTGGVFTLTMQDTSLGYIISVGTPAEYRLAFNSVNLTHSYFNNSDENGLNGWDMDDFGVIGFNRGNYHFYNVFPDASNTLITFSTTNTGSFYFQQDYVYFNSTYDQLNIINETLGINYTVSGLSKLDLCYWYEITASKFPLWNTVEYQVIGLYNGIWRIHNTTSFSFGTWYNFVPQDLITLHIYTFNSIGLPENNVDIMIKNNDTGTGYYIELNTEDNLTVEPGNLFFLCAGNSDTLEKKIFVIEILVNTTVLIYLNLTSTLDIDKELMDYQYEQRKELAMFYVYVLILVVIGLILFYIGYTYVWNHF